MNHYYYYYYVLFVLSSLALLAKCSENDVNSLARGFGDKIKWVKLEESAALAKSTSKPIFLLIHKSWCGACQHLKPKLAESLKFQELSENFVMVNVEDNEEPNDVNYAPDGGYIPRILFMDSENNVKPEIYNMNGNPQYKYYYSSADQVVSSMENTLRVFANYKTSINIDDEGKTGDDDVATADKINNEL